MKRRIISVLNVLLVCVCMLSIASCEKESPKPEQPTGTNPVQQITDAPTVTTTAATEISKTTAKTGGVASTVDGADITRRGVCYSATNQNPTVDNDSCIEYGTGAGTFNCTITDLTAATTYYVRAFATNKNGTSYGESLSFTTLSDSGTGSGTGSGTAVIWDNPTFLHNCNSMFEGTAIKTKSTVTDNKCIVVPISNKEGVGSDISFSDSAYVFGKAIYQNNTINGYMVQVLFKVKNVSDKEYKTVYIKKISMNNGSGSKMFSMQDTYVSGPQMALVNSTTSSNKLLKKTGETGSEAWVITAGKLVNKADFDNLSSIVAEVWLDENPATGDSRVIDLPYELKPVSFSFNPGTDESNIIEVNFENTSNKQLKLGSLGTTVVLFNGAKVSQIKVLDNDPSNGLVNAGGTIKSKYSLAGDNFEADKALVIFRYGAID